MQMRKETSDRRLCTAQSAAKLVSVDLPENVRISLDWSESGSYDRSRLFAYLDQWLEPWSDERASSRDYRILYLDVAAAHFGKDVEEYCWAKGYVYLFHYGGATGICQVNDTHCHLQPAQFYLEREQAFFHRDSTVRPWQRERGIGSGRGRCGDDVA